TPSSSSFSSPSFSSSTHTAPVFEWWTALPSTPTQRTSHDFTTDFEWTTRSAPTIEFSPRLSTTSRSNNGEEELGDWQEKPIDSSTQRNTKNTPSSRVPTTTTSEETTTEEFNEESTTTELPSTTPELIVYKTTKFKDLMKRAHIDMGMFTTTTTTEATTTTEEATTKEPTTTTTEENSEEREAEEMVIESVAVTTEVPLPPSLSIPDRTPLPHPPMLFHSSLEDEFPRPGWVKEEKTPKITKPSVEEQKKNEGEGGNVVDTV
ncbi:hypothetical protein PFISCL1PPCAC_20093, partial [Pristionchus fissidentatus]